MRENELLLNSKKASTLYNVPSFYNKYTITVARIN